jgi:hypothetical protein
MPAASDRAVTVLPVPPLCVQIARVFGIWVYIKRNKFRQIREEGSEGVRTSNTYENHRHAGEAEPIADAFYGVEAPGRNAVDPTLAPPTCSVTASCGLEALDLREEPRRRVKHTELSDLDKSREFERVQNRRDFRSLTPASYPQPQTIGGHDVATRWIDFAELKRQVSIHDVLARYGILDGLREKKPGKLVGACPIHGGKNGTSFNVDTDKNVFHCFSECGGGNILDLVMKLEDCSIREAGEKLSDWFELRFERRGGIAKSAKRRPKRRNATASHNSGRSDASRVNPPLERPLKGLNHDHPYLVERSVTAPAA